MESDGSKQWRMPWQLWCVGLILWSCLLLAPGNWFPGGASTHNVGGIGLGKLLHVGSYAMLSGLAGWLPFPRRQRLWCSFGLILHGGLTELMQTRVPFREGSPKDVGIDIIGVLLGWLVTFRRWPA